MGWKETQPGSSAIEGSKVANLYLEAHVPATDQLRRSCERDVKSSNFAGCFYGEMDLFVELLRF